MNWKPIRTTIYNIEDKGESVLVSDGRNIDLIYRGGDIWYYCYSGKEVQIQVDL